MWIARDEAGGENIANEELVLSRAYYIECVDAAQLDSRTGEVERFSAVARRAYCRAVPTWESELYIWHYEKLQRFPIPWALSSKFIAQG